MPSARQPFVLPRNCLPGKVSRALCELCIRSAKVPNATLVALWGDDGSGYAFLFFAVAVSRCPRAVCPKRRGPSNSIRGGKFVEAFLSGDLATDTSASADSKDGWRGTAPCGRQCSTWIDSELRRLLCGADTPRHCAGERPTYGASPDCQSGSDRVSDGGLQQ